MAVVVAAGVVVVIFVQLNEQNVKLHFLQS
jgi:hypothetical protein